MEPKLTQREQSVMFYLVQGLKNEEISQKLNISVHTTKAHLEAIYEKLNVTNRVQAVVRAIYLNLVDINSLV